MIPHQTTIIFCGSSQQLPHPSLGPLKGFLSWSRALNWPLQLLLVTTETQGHGWVWCHSRPGGPWTPPRTIDANLDCAFVKKRHLLFVVPNIGMAWQSPLVPIQLRKRRPGLIPISGSTLQRLLAPWISRNLDFVATNKIRRGVSLYRLYSDLWSKERLRLLLIQMGKRVVTNLTRYSRRNIWPVYSLIFECLFGRKVLL